MKKLLLSLSLLGLYGSMSAQMNVVLTDSVGNILNGNTVNLTIPNNVLDSRPSWHITNAGSSQINIKVKKTILALNDPGATVYFCTDVNCYSPVQTMSYAVALAGNGGTDLLTTDHYPNNVSGVTTVRYTVINQANTSDTTYFVINYTDVNPNGINTHALVKASVSNPAPNPASAIFSLNYKLGSANPDGAKMVIYNMLGARVMETRIEESEGVLKTDVSTLDQGVYFCSLESDGHILATRRLVVTH